MRIECTFQTEKIPVSYHYMMVSIIKEALFLSAPQKADELYNYNGKRNKKSKPFSFAVLLNQFKKEEHEFFIFGNVKMIVSAFDPQWLLYLYNGLIQRKKFSYRQYHLELRHVRVLPEKLPSSTICTFRTLSPIVMRNKQGMFISPDHPGFHPTLQYICNQTLENATGKGLQGAVHFTPIFMKKIVVQQQHEHFMSLNEKSILYIDAYTGLFTLQGSIEDLQRLTQIGIGFRRSQGFGCIELVEQ
ncbi:CRISPR-associated endoribonuclease Cas6 [Geobacillus subterraneus]|uniref:CRISPR-associated endoribonuclease Cas6 n=1 Tax=Geobacillus subterraneus TaxID=129338 RepID=UPI002AC8F4F1|nr:CRISPR-associated endoribonuclease Cas6 [Geobacillus subterraneus]WPZ19204.1 CRISPR-associated endoribonuclease Cas6 [Geobacillus subterraneus]